MSIMFRPDGQEEAIDLATLQGQGYWLVWPGRERLSNYRELVNPGGVVETTGHLVG